MSASESSLHRVLLYAALALLLVALASPALADDDGQPLETKIISATVYGHQAQMVRRGEVMLEPGAVQLVCRDLPERFIESSLSVEGTGLEGARIIGIDLRRTERSEVDSPRYKELAAELLELEAEMERLRIRHEALGKRKTLAWKISEFTSDVGKEQMAEGEFAPSYWEGVLAFFENENVSTADRTEELEHEMEEVESRRAWVRAELRAMQVGEGPGKEVVVDCETDSGGSLTVELTYLVPDATWYPEYTVRYIERDDEVELTYAARISQATGEDWKGVSAVLSTATPHIGAAPPELIPLYVGGTTGTIRGRVTDSSSGSPLPYANISVLGTAYGTIANKDGVYAIADVPAGSHKLQFSYMGFRTQRRSRVRVNVGRVTRLDVALEPEMLAADEIMVMVDRPMVDVEATRTTRSMDRAGVVSEGELHVRGGRTEDLSYYVEEPPSIPHVEAEVLGSEFAANLVIPKALDLDTGAEPRRSLVVRRRIPGRFILQSVPRLSEHVFVRGELTNPLDFPLLPGSAETYVETVPEGGSAKISNFVGKDRIEAIASGEKFEMHLGVDQNVKVEHTLKKKEMLSKADARTTKVRYTYLITAESFRRGPAELHVEDRVPVSTIKEVKVDDLEIVPEPDEHTEEGLLTWKLAMEPGDRREITIEYVVEYPSTMSARALGLED